MSGSLAVDTNAVIAYFSGNSLVCGLVENADTLFLPAVVLGELTYGALNSAQPQKNKQTVYKFLAQTLLIPVDESIAVRYAKTRLALKKKGCPIPENDLWIAASCLEFDVLLLSADAHFKKIDGLKVINWLKK